MAAPRFRAEVLRGARVQAGLTQLQLAIVAAEASHDQDLASSPDRRRRQVGVWEGRIGAWERGVDAPSAPYVPTLARALNLDPLALFDIDPRSPTFSALRLAAGLTLQAVAASTGLSYTSMHRMTRGVSRLSADAAQQLADILHVTIPDLVAAIERER